MGQKKQILVLITAFVMLLGLVWLMAASHEPAYQGKKLRVWIVEFNPAQWPTDPAGPALRHFGTNATPPLIRMLRSRDTDLTAKALQLLPRQSVIKIKYQPAGFEQRRALDVASYLGSDVRGTAPALVALVDDFPAKIKDASLASFAENTLSQMKAEGIHGLIHLLAHPDPGIRSRAAQLLGTAPDVFDSEINAALQKHLPANDPSLHAAVVKSLGQIQQRHGTTVSASSGDWNQEPAAAVNSPPAVWNADSGVKVVSSSGLYPGFSALDFFGTRLSTSGTGETGSVVFQDVQPDGFVHFIEWATPLPVTVRSFGLVAGHDGASTGFQRAFKTFRLYARGDDESAFKLVFSGDFAVPYGEGHYSSMLYLFRNLDSPATARQFRVEFVQNGGGSWPGPRAIKLYGFSTGLNLPMVTTALQNQPSHIRDEAMRLLSVIK